MRAATDCFVVIVTTAALSFSRGVQSFTIGRELETLAQNLPQNQWSGLSNIGVVAITALVSSIVLVSFIFLLGFSLVGSLSCINDSLCRDSEDDCHGQDSEGDCHGQDSDDDGVHTSSPPYQELVEIDLAKEDVDTRECNEIKLEFWKIKECA